MSNLQFREKVTVSTTIPKYKAYLGRIIDHMPQLLADGRCLTTPKQLMYARVHEKNEHDRDLLRGNFVCVYTACAVCVAPDKTGEVAIGLYSNPTVRELIDSLFPESNVVDGSLVLTLDQYHAVRDDAFVLAPDVTNSLQNNPRGELKEREAFWEYVAEGDKNLVTDTSKLIKEKTRSDRLEKIMVWYVTTIPGLRLLCLDSVGYDYSIALGYYDLDVSHGHLVGVAQGDNARRARAKNDLAERAKSMFPEDAIQKLLTKDIGLTDARAAAYFDNLRAYAKKVK